MQNLPKKVRLGVPTQVPTCVRKITKIYEYLYDNKWGLLHRRNNRKIFQINRNKREGIIFHENYLQYFICSIREGNMIANIWLKRRVGKIETVIR